MRKANSMDEKNKKNSRKWKHGAPHNSAQTDFQKIFLICSVRFFLRLEILDKNEKLSK